MTPTQCRAYAKRLQREQQVSNAAALYVRDLIAQLQQADAAGARLQRVNLVRPRSRIEAAAFEQVTDGLQREYADMRIIMRTLDTNETKAQS